METRPSGKLSEQHSSGILAGQSVHVSGEGRDAIPPAGLAELALSGEGGNGLPAGLGGPPGSGSGGSQDDDELDAAIRVLHETKDSSNR